MNQDSQEAAAVNFYTSQKNFYSKKAALNKKNHKTAQLVVSFGQIAVLGFSALQIIFNLGIWGSILLICTSLAVLFAAAMEKNNHYGEMWLNYRLMAEALRQEYALFTTRAGRYSSKIITDTPAALFTERCVELCSGENQDFMLRTKQQLLEQQKILEQQIQHMLNRKDDSTLPSNQKDR
ncbi:MAG: DUF4231 domain-containing protein [Aggregatilineales bacterium]